MPKFPLPDFGYNFINEFQRSSAFFTLYRPSNETLDK